MSTYAILLWKLLWSGREDGVVGGRSARCFMLSWVIIFSFLSSCVGSSVVNCGGFGLFFLWASEVCLERERERGGWDLFMEDRSIGGGICVIRLTRAWDLKRFDSYVVKFSYDFIWQLLCKRIISLSVSGFTIWFYGFVCLR